MTCFSRFTPSASISRLELAKASLGFVRVEIAPFGVDRRAVALWWRWDDGSAEDAVTFDGLLADLGLFEVVAARLELAAEALSGEERARARAAQGRVCAGPIGGAGLALPAGTCSLM